MAQGSQEPDGPSMQGFDPGIHADLNYKKKLMRETAAGGSGMSPLEVVRRGLRGSKEEYEHSASTLYRNPCFRESLMWGIGLGLLFGLHRYKETGNVMRFVDWAMAGWFGVSAIGWGVCRWNEIYKVAAMQEWYDDRRSGKLDEKIEQARKKFLESVDHPPVSSPASPDAPGQRA
jgi:Protein of unknown function (DUF3767)